MRTFPGRLSAAILLVAVLITSPIWFPSLSALAAQRQNTVENPRDETSTFYILDGGWIAGSLKQKVLAVPQVLSWSPGKDEANWAAETGFLYGGFRDATTGLIYITEMRSSHQDSLLNLAFDPNSVYASGTEWILYLTVLDEKALPPFQPSGSRFSRVALNLPYREAGGASLHPIGFSGSKVYLQDFSSDGGNLFAYDLVAQELEEIWTLCEKGYVMEAEFISNPSRVVALCMDFSTRLQSSVALTNLEDNTQLSLELPALGEEDYQTGNGIFTANGSLYVIDTDEGVLAQIDLSTMRIVDQSDYRKGLGAEQPGWIDNLLAWLKYQLAEPAYAKRWMALTAVSPDGRWLMVDGGLGTRQETKRELVLIDLRSLQATRIFQLAQTPANIAFGSDGKLLVLFDRRSLASGTPGVVLDVSTGNQQTVLVPTHGWILDITSGD